MNGGASNNIFTNIQRGRVVGAHVGFLVMKAGLPVPVHIDKGEGLFPMRGVGRADRRQVPSATCSTTRIAFSINPFKALLLGLLVRRSLLPRHCVQIIVLRGSTLDHTP